MAGAEALVAVSLISTLYGVASTRMAADRARPNMPALPDALDEPTKAPTQASYNRLNKQAQLRAADQSTLLTSPLGLPGEPNAPRRTLLGG
jgi:hypothetical protein